VELVIDASKIHGRHHQASRAAPPLKRLLLPDQLPDAATAIRCEGGSGELEAVLEVGNEESIVVFCYYQIVQPGHLLVA
jgi:hypothetical protein